jgi:polyvinyl alcohol dehydrogenase (cytochrome)
MTGGSMRYQSLHLTGAERRAIAEYLSRKKLSGDRAGATLGRCTERVWKSDPQPLKCLSGPGCNAAQQAQPTVIPGVVFSGSMDGALRAYSTTDGSIIWDVDTNREYATVNGVPARGASLNAAGPIVVGGMLYVTSGYGYLGGRPGNVLLAFGLD